MDDLAKCLANRVDMTRDGHRAYIEAVEGAFGSDIDYAQLVKLYGAGIRPSKSPPAMAAGFISTSVTC
jgi:hypothetical protein